MQDDKTLLDALQRLFALRQHAFHQAQLQPEQWQSYLQIATELCSADSAFLVEFESADNYILRHTHQLACSLAQEWLQTPELKGFLGKVRNKGYGVRMPNPQLPWSDLLLGVSFPSSANLLLLISISPREHDRVNELLMRALMMTDVALDHSIQAEPPQSLNGKMLMPLLELLDELYRARDFQTAAYALVNGVVSHCPEVSQAVLGWREGAYMRVRAISHFERFERKTDTVRFFEAALEEAADQGVVMRIGESDDIPADFIGVAHKQLVTQLGSDALITIPLFDSNGETLGALMLVSYDRSIDQSVLPALQFVVQTAITHLQILREDEAGLFMRVIRRASRSLGQLFGPENLWVKVSVLTLSALLIFAMVIEVPHRVRGSAQFVTDETRLLVAPFNAVVADVWATSGDIVSRDQSLIVLDTQELLLQQAELESEIQRNQAELDRARAEFANVDMAIADARLEQTQARLAQVNYLINQATLRSPFDGIVVEGDRRDLLSRPVTRGEVLMRIAEPSGLYLVIEIADKDIQYVQAEMHGEFALVSQPGERIPLMIERIVPMAVMGSHGGAVFEVKAELTGDVQTWWRPGMAGVARIDAGKRSLLWVWFHSAWNRIRLLLWF